MMQTNRKSAASAATLKEDKVNSMIRDRDLAGLEKLVLEGHGDDLFGKVARDPQTSAFLKSVPGLQNSVEEIWEAAGKGQLKTVQNMLKEDKRLIHSKNGKGEGLLHAAVRADGHDLTAWLATKYPETLELRDKDGRTALHYAGAVRDPHAMFAILEKAGADSHITDKHGHLPSYYIRHPEELRSSKSNKSKAASNDDDKKPSPKGFRSEPNTPRRSVTQLASARSASLADLGRQQQGPQDSAGRGSLNGSASGVLTGGAAVNRANIRKWIHEKDLGRLQQLVIEGYGNRLLYETASSSTIRKFLETVPVSMRSIKDVHRAVVEGKARDLEEYANREDILLSRDQYGQTPLHKAAALGNHNIAEFLIRNCRGSLEVRDHDNRIPLHMAAAPSNNKARAAMYELLKRGSDVNAVDVKGKTASYYQNHPNELNVQHIREIPEAPRASSQTLSSDTRSVEAATPPKKKQDSGGKEKEKARTTKSPPLDPIKEREKEKLRSPKTPPLDPVSVRSVSEDQIEKWVRAGDLERLEQLVLEGKGRRLQGRTSWDDEVRQFLKNVPKTMDKIAALHSAAGRGDLAQVKSICRGADARLAVAKNEAGATPLHQAALQGHADVAGYLADVAPDTLRMGDMDKRTPLHYAALGKDRRRATQLFDLLVKEGADKKAKDAKGNPAETYLNGAALRNLDDSGEQKLSEYPPQRKPLSRQNTFDGGTKHPQEQRKSARTKEELPSFRTEQGHYLASALGDALKKGLAEVASKRPKDPVSYLGTFLYSYSSANDGQRSAKSLDGRNKSSGERNRSRSMSRLDENRDDDRDERETKRHSKPFDKEDRRSSRSTRSLLDYDDDRHRRNIDYDDNLDDMADLRHAKRRMSQAELNAREDLRKVTANRH